MAADNIEIDQEDPAAWPTQKMGEANPKKGYSQAKIYKPDHSGLSTKLFSTYIALELSVTGRA